MTRVKRGHIRRKRRQRKFKMMKGTASSILLKKTNQQYLKAYQNAFIDRRLRKRYFRRIWICRINAKIRQFGFNYHSLSTKFPRSCVGGREPSLQELTHSRVSSSLVNFSYFNRKILAQLILHDFSLFNHLNIPLRLNNK